MKRLLGLALALAALPAAPAHAATPDPNEVSPQTHIQPSGRLLLPYGRMRAVGNHPGRAALIDTRTKQVTYVQVGAYPYGAGITRDGKNALISNEADGTVSVIDLA